MLSLPRLKSHQTSCLCSILAVFKLPCCRRGLRRKGFRPRPQQRRQDRRATDGGAEGERSRSERPHKLPHRQDELPRGQHERLKTSIDSRPYNFGPRMTLDFKMCDVYLKKMSTKVFWWCWIEDFWKDKNICIYCKHSCCLVIIAIVLLNYFHSYVIFWYKIVTLIFCILYVFSFFATNTNS